MTQRLNDCGWVLLGRPVAHVHNLAWGNTEGDQLPLLWPHSSARHLGCLKIMKHVWKQREISGDLRFRSWKMRDVEAANSDLWARAFKSWPYWLLASHSGQVDPHDGHVIAIEGALSLFEPKRSSFFFTCFYAEKKNGARRSQAIPKYHTYNISMQ